jgi:arabinoxylan arabinofuranohydrolase
MSPTRAKLGRVTQSVALKVWETTMSENIANCETAETKYNTTSNHGNPILVGLGVCDPQIRIYGDCAYLYATHDLSPDSPGYLTADWWIWRSEDLVAWEHVGNLRPEDTYFGKSSRECWATDAISRNGKYYLYFSMGMRNIGVVVADSPKGPWRDPIGKPLLADGIVPVEARDPGIYQDDDGSSWIVFGTWDFYIAKLNEDMVSLAEPPRQLLLDQKMGPYGPGKLDDKPFIHSRNGLYYLSWGCYHAISNNVYGPYTYKGSIVVSERTSPDFQKGLTMDRHGSFFDLHNQSYFACNDQSYPGSTEYFRNTVISYVHYRESGEIEPIYLDRIGVGQYDARQTRIEAENYFLLAGGMKSQCPEGGYELRRLSGGSSVVYPNVRHLSPNSIMSFRATSVDGAIIEIHDADPSGDLLGVCHIPATGDWSSYVTTSTKLANTSEELDICLVVATESNDGTEAIRLNWISFQDMKN